jgi:hypothetical protein
MQITATEERLRRQLSCTQQSPEEKSNADSDRTATESRPWHSQPCTDAARIFPYLARVCTAKTAADRHEREALPGLFLRQHPVWSFLYLYHAGRE